MSLAALVVELSANTAKFQSDMGKAVHMAERGAFAIKSAFAALGIGLGVAAILNFSKSVVSAAAALDDMSEKTGATVEELSRLEQVARIGGHQMETVEMSLVRLSKAINGTEEDSKGAGKALAALGLSADTLRNQDTAVAMRAIAIELNKFADGSGKTALAMDLLGKSGAQALPFLKDLATEHGIATRVTAEQAAAAEDLQKAIGRLKNELMGLAQELAISSVPAMNDWMAANKEGIRIAGSFREMLRLFVFDLDAMTTEKPREEIKRLNDELMRFQSRSAYGKWSGQAFNFFGDTESDLKKKIEFLKYLERQQAIAGAALFGGDTPGERQRFGLAGAVKPRLDYKSDDTKAAAEKAAAERKRMRDLDNAGWVKYIDTMTQEYEDELREMTKIDNAARAVSEKGRAEGMQAYFKIIDDQEAAAIEAGEAILAASKKTTDEMTEFWKSAAKNMQGAMSDFFFDVMQGNLSDLGSSFKRTIDRMMADMLAAKAATALFGADFGKGGAIGGLVGKAAGFIGGLFGGGGSLLDSAGNTGLGFSGYATGTDFVPRTGLAMVHQGEAIIPAAENVGGRRGGPVFNVDLRGASVDAVARLERFVAQLHGSIEHRALRAVADARMR